MLKIVQLLATILCNRDTAVDAGPGEPYLPANEPSSSNSAPRTSTATYNTFQGFHRRNAVRRPPTPRIRGQTEIINGIHPDPPTTWRGAF